MTISKRNGDMIILKRITTANMNDDGPEPPAGIRPMRWTRRADPDAAAGKIRRVRGRRRPGYGSVPVITGPVGAHFCTWMPEWCAALDGSDSRDRGRLYAAFNGRFPCVAMTFDSAYADGKIMHYVFSPSGHLRAFAPARISEKCLHCSLNRGYNLSVRNQLSHYNSLYKMSVVDGDKSWSEYIDAVMIFNYRLLEHIPPAMIQTDGRDPAIWRRGVKF